MSEQDDYRELGKLIFETEQLVAPDGDEWNTIPEREREFYEVVAEKLVFFNLDLLKRILAEHE